MAEDKPGMKRFQKPIGYLISVVAAATLSVAIFAGVQYFAARRASQNLLDNPASAESKPNPSSSDGVSQLKQTSESFRQVAKAVGPAVVNIKSTKSNKNRSRLRKAAPGGRRGAPAPDEGNPFGGDGSDDPFFDFFQRFGHPFMQPDTPQTSLGSGFIIDKKGYVVTNNHVVEDASEILVSLSNDRTDLKAKVIGTDPKTDLALLKIESAKDLPVAEWADSDSVEVGDWAVAIGSPFDLRQTVTVGIVSAKGRSSNVLAGAEYVGELIQTDAAINPGNSGGPLCTLEGKIMGVNTAIYTRSGGYMGIGFAIPSNMAKDVISKLKTDGKIIRGWLGVFIQPLEAELATKMGVKEGVGIHEVIDGSPAADAGINAGDVVIEVEGKPVKDVAQLQKIISNFKPGQSVKMKLMNFDRKTKTVTVKIGEVPTDSNPGSLAQSPEDQRTPDRLGLVVGEQKGKDGVVVQAVEPGSVGEGIGLSPGDLVLRINDTQTKTLPAYKKALKAAKGITNILVKEKGKVRWFSVPINNE